MTAALHDTYMGFQKLNASFCPIYTHTVMGESITGMHKKKKNQCFFFYLYLTNVDNNLSLDLSTFFVE